MALTSITKPQCIHSLQDYANKRVRSWNPFKLFRKIKLPHHDTAIHLITILEKETLTDTDFLEIARAVDGFNDIGVQEDLLSFLHSEIRKPHNPLLAKRKHVDEIKNILQALANKTYRPWWTLFLIAKPYFSDVFRDNVRWLSTRINDLFITRRGEAKQYLLEAYSNEVIAFQIANDYKNLGDSTTSEEGELKKIIDISLQETCDETQDALLQEIKETLKTNVPFGRVLISVAGLAAILNTYLSKAENQDKPRGVQVQEIIAIIGNVFLKTHTTQMLSSIFGMEDIVKAAVSVAVSKSATNPLRTDKKVATAVAAVTGGAIGGTLGSVIPGFGTSVGIFVGTVVSKTIVTRAYQVLEEWQKAPKGPDSIVPPYNYALFSIIDNDRKNVLQPLYEQYLDNERRLKKLGDEVAQWLTIYYTLTQQSDETISEEDLEIIQEEMERLRSEFIQLKSTHGRVVLNLGQHEKRQNKERILAYLRALKPCLWDLQEPIINMLNNYFPDKRIDSVKMEANANPYASPKMASVVSTKEGIVRAPLSSARETEASDDEFPNELPTSEVRRLSTR